MMLFIIGMAAGIALHRLIMALILWCDPDSSIAFCCWRHKKDCPRFRCGQLK